MQQGRSIRTSYRLHRFEILLKISQDYYFPHLEDYREYLLV
jgi:hypothetical protein